MQLIKLVICIAVGVSVAKIIGIHDLAQANWYIFTVAALLASGLYASTYGIDLQEARKHVRIIVSAVTIGVLLKAAIIGCTLAFLFHDPFFIILGITVAQIDPLSVAGLLKNRRMSVKAKTILASWASFDDPITVILSLYAPLLIAQCFGTDLGTITGDTAATHNLTTYLRELGFNLGLAAQAFCLYTVLRFYAKHITAWLVVGVSLGCYVLLALTFSISVFYFMMLGIALIGLFLRPPHIDRYIDAVITWALRAATVLLGIVLIGGVNLWAGIALGVSAYCAQILVGFLLTTSLPSKDRWHIAFAQQNGITAIILALLFEPLHAGTVAIVAPAVIVTNSLHDVANRLLDKYVLAVKQ
jgi:NhaP-type Na+/H+ or K+/H+ antiporter